jgi:hypothetical protein
MKMTKYQCLPHKINFSYSKDLAYDYRYYSGTLEELAMLVSSDINYSPFNFEGGHRKEINSNLEMCNCIMLDFDDGMTLNEATHFFSQYINIIATTKSHQKEKNGFVCDRFRVILPTSRDFINITIDEYKIMMSLLIERYKSDSSCKDIARFYYGTANSKTYINSSGFLFDIDVLLNQAMYLHNLKQKKKEAETEALKQPIQKPKSNYNFDTKDNITKKEWFEKYSHTQQMLNYFEFSSRFGAGGRNTYLFGVAKHFQEHGCDANFIKYEVLWINSQGDGIDEVEIINTIFRSMKL